MSTVDLDRPLGRPIKGPSAIGGDVGRFLSLSWTLAVLEFRLKFFGSALGYLWQLVKPLMLFGVLYFVFTEFVRVGDAVEFYPVLLLTNLMLYFFYAEATTAAVTSVVDRENIVRKIHFPRLAIPVSVVLTATFNLLLNFIAVLVFMVVSGVDIRLEWLLLVPLFGLLVVFTAGVSMFLSALFVRFRDVKPIWEVVLPVTLYGTPILYPIETVQAEYPTLAKFFMFNPLAALLQQVRHDVIDPSAPSAADIAGGKAWLLVPIGVIALVWVLGLWLFNREAPHVAEDL